MGLPDTGASAYRHANENKSSGTPDTKRNSLDTQLLGHIAPNSGPFHLRSPNIAQNGREKKKKTKNKTRKLLSAAYANTRPCIHNGNGQNAITRDIVIGALRFRIQLHLIHGAKYVKSLFLSDLASASR